MLDALHSDSLRLPAIHVERLDDWPETVEGKELEFRLTYRGRLPSVGGNDRRIEDKHRIRKEIHRQLAYLWSSRPLLTSMSRNDAYMEMLVAKYARCGFNFIPLVGDSEGLACSLDILFLRRDQPGNMVTHRGDIDNRLKVLFDALQIPNNCEQLPRGAKPEAGEDPFFCLLFDDRLITEIKVTTDHLLTPVVAGESVNDVELIIAVRTLHAHSDELELVR